MIIESEFSDNAEGEEIFKKHLTLKLRYDIISTLTIWQRIKYAGVAELADALASGNVTLLKDMSIDKIWNNIIKYQGEQFFTTVKKKPFSYIVNGNSIVLQNTNRIIPRSNVERALEINSPTVSKFVGMNLQGPSYLLAIITDNRIIG